MDAKDVDEEEEEEECPSDRDCGKTEAAAVAGGDSKLSDDESWRKNYVDAATKNAKEYLDDDVVVVDVVDVVVAVIVDEMGERRRVAGAVAGRKIDMNLGEARMSMKIRSKRLGKATSRESEESRRYFRANRTCRDCSYCSRC